MINAKEAKENADKHIDRVIEKARQEIFSSIQAASNRGLYDCSVTFFPSVPIEMLFEELTRLGYSYSYMRSGIERTLIIRWS